MYLHFYHNVNRTISHIFLILKVYLNNFRSQNIFINIFVYINWFNAFLILYNCIVAINYWFTFFTKVVIRIYDTTFHFYYFTSVYYLGYSFPLIGCERSTYHKITRPGMHIPRTPMQHPRTSM